MESDILRNKLFLICFCSDVSHLDVSKGIKVNAINSEIDNEKTMVIAISLNIIPAIPGTNKIGIKTANVVNVEAIIAFET